MLCPLTLIDKHQSTYDCFPECAALVLVDNGKKLVCGLIASAVVPFEGAPALAANWLESDKLRKEGDAS